MSGTNAHFVLESYSAKNEISHGVRAPYNLLALSAKTEEALEEKVKNTIQALTVAGIRTNNLADLCYTLLDGRRHFDHRMVIVISDPDDAVRVLARSASAEKLPNLFRGKVARDFTAAKAMLEYAKTLLDRITTEKENTGAYRESLFALADLYCQGYEIPWGRLFDSEKPHRIHLPTYPFARERYWITESSVDTGSKPDAWGTIPVLHTLLHENRSDFAE